MDLPPPGVAFFPSDEQLVSYLANKNNEEVQNFHGSDRIKELRLYRYDPFELHLAQSFFFPHTREFYCFTAKTEEPRRHCKTGFWMQKGAVRDITVGADDVLVGKKSLFIFYIGNSPQNAIKTSWTMYEYTLVNNPQVCHLGKLTFRMFFISSMINLCIGKD
jgi:hypothetical protein